MDNQLENLFTSLSISSDAITKEDFKKKDCKKGKGGWQKEDLLKICKDLGIKLTSKDKASKEILCQKINDYFNKIVATSNVATSDVATSDTTTVTTTNSNLENLPNEIIIQILEKMPPSSVFTIIKASKRINMLFNKFKNSIIKNHKRYGGVDLRPLFLYNIMNNKDLRLTSVQRKAALKEAINFVYEYLFEGDASQVNIKKWIKKLMDKSGELSADEAIIILEFIKKNNFKSSEFILKYIKRKLDLNKIQNLEAFDVILDINYELNEKMQNSDDDEDSDEEGGGRWPGNEIFDNQIFERWFEDVVKNLVLKDRNPEKFNIIKKNKNIREIARLFSDDEYEDELLGGWGKHHSFENDRESDNFKKYFPKLYKKYYKVNRTL